MPYGFCLVRSYRALGPAALIDLQEKKLERMRIGGGSATATQMSLWFAKEGCYYEKNGLSVEPISIPGSSLALQAMLSGELPIIQVRGAAPIQAHLSGTDMVIIATVVKNFTFRIYGYASINRMEDLKGKIFDVTRFGTQTDLAAASPCAAPASTPSAM